MNQKQLANVLIKVVGVLVCAESVGGVFSAVLTMIQLLTDHARGYSQHNNLTVWTYPLMHLIQPVVGVWLVMRSRWLADKLFPDDGTKS